uniref:melanocortin-2 receptor accessory protein n=1 Tax=Podarcis muralis TaxID=64176 RepID=UPI00109FD153|nr:melanocortin-2 receptor accessory protein [Podarcis muralis]
MANKTNSSSFTYDFEYYMDYLDLLPVDARKLKANRLFGVSGGCPHLKHYSSYSLGKKPSLSGHSIVIALWIGLASFVAFLFLILFYISRTGSTPVKPQKPQRGIPIQNSTC